MGIRPFQGVTPRLHPSVFVADGAQVIGNVEIGEGSSVWYNTVLRGDVNTIQHRGPQRSRTAFTSPRRTVL